LQIAWSVAPMSPGLGSCDGQLQGGAPDTP
jgi:hypothetical protein